MNPVLRSSIVSASKKLVCVGGCHSLVLEREDANNLIRSALFAFIACLSDLAHAIMMCSI